MLLEIYEGRVERQRIAEGSKSERETLVLVSNRTYVLRAPGAPAMGDTSLDHLEGKTGRFYGVTHLNTLHLSSWVIL